jgi:formamidopyrimidine-DNA glycosylase
MPELPEVQTTVQGLHETVIGKTITSLWSDLPTKNHVRKNEIKNLAFWNDFQKKVHGATIVSVERRGKNILIHLGNSYTLLIHMKMTGHLMVGNYRPGRKTDGKTEHDWKWWGDTEHLQDPFNRFIHFVATFSDGTSLAFCDARKFGTVTVVPTKNIHESSHLKNLGPDAVMDTITLELFISRLMKRSKKAIKTVLLDQTLITGIGNIYSDEMLWLAGIHPKRTPQSLSHTEWKKLWQSMRPVLEQGINFGGDSTSDYRNVFGKAGEFHHAHNAYRKTGKPCTKKSCKGKIERIVQDGRSAHFCNIHQQ